MSRVTLSKIFILLSHERSGSHLVGEYINSLQNFRMVDEICNPDAVRPVRHPESFLRFRNDYAARRPEFVMEPTRGRHEEFLGAFFAHLTELKKPRSIAIDIKYGHVHNFEAWWWQPLARPRLFEHCSEHDIGVVHLYRTNVVEAIVSGMVASKRRVWHSWQPHAAETAGATFALPAAEIVRLAKQLKLHQELFEDWTKQTRKLEIRYEEIVPRLGVKGGADARLCEFLETQPKHPFSPRGQKVTPALRQVVENYDELMQECEMAGLGWCLS